MPQDMPRGDRESERAQRSPIVCTLPAQDHQARAAAFRQAFSHLVQTERLEHGFLWRFVAAPGLSERLDELARREHACCRFLVFRLVDEGSTIVWYTHAEEGARDVVDAFMRLPETLGDKNGELMRRVLSEAGLSFVSDRE